MRSFASLRRIAATALLILFGATLQANAASRIKDIADFEGIRDNQLIGYGLVVGLQGTGDSLNASPFTRQSLQAMLERLGVNTNEADLNTKNTAAVMVTANLPAFSTQGTRIDVTVSALGDAKNLQGGTLLVTPLMALTVKPTPSHKAHWRLLALQHRAKPLLSFAASQHQAAFQTAHLLNVKLNSNSLHSAPFALLCATRT